jgi:predicted acetyltransferase
MLQTVRNGIAMNNVHAIFGAGARKNTIIAIENTSIIQDWIRTYLGP